ncbi:hypothetical protein [Myceligenerans salitolerans]|uniref:Tripartite tricarboxylate transporter TctB family protein n=1 Tax=Myceligenerans salitolerans TaxID=1230528 RepID=A0ABS3I6V3_9MICO|nr:hypothetical protein [Myceligenerans salitolerans]MBO0608725.1 hypothetical protein [Myceligenerans salitolerans]
MSIEDGGETAPVGITPTYAALLAFAGISVLYLPLLGLTIALVTGIVGRRRPWVLAAASVVAAWATLAMVFFLIPEMLGRVGL